MTDQPLLPSLAARHNRPQMVMTLTARLARNPVDNAKAAKHKFLTGASILVDSNPLPILGSAEEIPDKTFIRLRFGHNGHWVTLQKGTCTDCGCVIDLVSDSRGWCEECVKEHAPVLKVSGIKKKSLKAKLAGVDKATLKALLKEAIKNKK